MKISEVVEEVIAYVIVIPVFAVAMTIFTVSNIFR